MIFIVPAERRQANSGGQKCIASIGENACLRSCADNRLLWQNVAQLVTRRIKASQMLQSIVCAFRSIAGAATAEKLVLSPLTAIQTWPPTNALFFTRPYLNNRFQLAAEVVYSKFGSLTQVHNVVRPRNAPKAVVLQVLIVFRLAFVHFWELSIILLCTG